MPLTALKPEVMSAYPDQFDDWSSGVVETVRVAACVVAFPDALVNTASYSYPFSEVWAVKE